MTKFRVQRWDERSETWRTLTVDWGTRERAIDYVNNNPGHRALDENGRLIANRWREGGWCLR